MKYCGLRLNIQSKLIVTLLLYAASNLACGPFGGDDVSYSHVHFLTNLAGMVEVGGRS